MLPFHRLRSLLAFLGSQNQHGICSIPLGGKHVYRCDEVDAVAVAKFGVTNDVKDYSVGEDLLGDAVKRDWIISSNYSGYAIITEDNILEVSGGGQYQFMDKTNRQLKEQQPNFTYLQQALEQISRFSK